MMTHGRLLIPLVLLGCAQRNETDAFLIETPDLEGVASLVSRGDLVYLGHGPADEVGVEISRWGRGMFASQAARRVDRVELEHDYRDGWLTADLIASHRKAGGDLMLVGPEWVHLDLIAAEGHVELARVDGAHVVTAHSIGGTEVIGAVDLFAGGAGIDLSFYPVPGTDSVMESLSGDVSLRLPVGGDYTVEAYVDPYYSAWIDVPGLVVEEHVGDRILAISGRGDAWLTVYVTGGSLDIRAAAGGDALSRR